MLVSSEQEQCGIEDRQNQKPGVFKLKKFHKAKIGKNSDDLSDVLREKQSLLSLGESTGSPL